MRFRERHESGGKRRADEGEEIRVTDRRRRYLNEEEAGTGDSDVPAPNLKPSYVEELEKRTQTAEQLALDVQSRFEQLKRKLQQETDETRQRLNRAADERTERGKAEFIASLLPVLDNLERAIDATDSEGATNQLLAGVKQTAETFLNALSAAGVERFVPLHEFFDPELHEAVETTPTEAEEDGKVVAVYTPGYRIADRLLRPARVAVGRATEKVQSANDYQT
ncbi:MAG TPA: nucleotide exchange factor GrpE [Pyrinomonadaceae bacterium]|nr:nucleotide exchange factor GrpE [Pyrinomonadaceae bacterium]